MFKYLLLILYVLLIVTQSYDIYNNKDDLQFVYYQSIISLVTIIIMEDLFIYLSLMLSILPVIMYMEINSNIDIPANHYNSTYL